jgi:hypothetical protein
MKMKATLFGRSFWSRGYFASTVGLDEAIHHRTREVKKDQIEFDFA